MSVDLGKIDFNSPKFTMVGGLSLRTLKIKYNWFLNAQVEDAIIGEDENGLVWFSGTWVCGEWVDGTWYSGEFLDGIWRNGNFYSYDIDIKEALKGILYINRTDIRKSRFKGGSFENGNFHFGIFGNILNESELDIIVNLTDKWVIDNIEDYTISGETFYDGSEQLKTAHFNNGKFNNGLFNSAYFNNGDWYNGIANNIIWYDGDWYDGKFIVGDWYNGTFYKGYFSNGNWYNGRFISSDVNNPNIFGLNYKSDYNYANWYNGEFISSIWFSGVESYSVHTPLKNNTISTWYNGTFTDSKWYGGTWQNGTWISGTFYFGYIIYIIWKNGYIVDCICDSGLFEKGEISGGVFDNAIFEDILLGIDN